MVEVRRVFDGQLLIHVLSTQGYPTSVALSSDGARVISTDFDGVVRLWDLVNGTLVYQNHNNSAVRMCVSRNSALIAEGGDLRFYNQFITKI